MVEINMWYGNRSWGTGEHKDDRVEIKKGFFSAAVAASEF
jgi:hypothetical protein